MVGDQHLPKKLKFKKHTKRSTHGVMALSLPTSTHYGTYVNAPLARFLRDKNIGCVEVYTDPEEEAVALAPTNDMQEGYKLIPTGERGLTLSAKLRRVMPHGRYVYQPDESSDKMMVFRREQIYFKGKNLTFPDKGVRR